MGAAVLPVLHRLMHKGDKDDFDFPSITAHCHWCGTNNCWVDGGKQHGLTSFGQDVPSSLPGCGSNSRCVQLTQQERVLMMAVTCWLT